MSPLIVIVASTQLSVLATINITAQPSQSIDECRKMGEAAIKAATATPGSSASYVCHDTTLQQGLSGALGVVTYQKEDGGITILEGYMATLSDCKVAGMIAAGSKVVPGTTAWAWACYDLDSFGG
ncbi:MULTISPECIES: hypothetical protein [unclassified Bradyrhizobium]|uniref:hypothetical protein n=1 Tax=Bradyrhizobium sp. USDA 4541 TaxID=2817704 RepID=UPI0020A5BB92|nr:hypothetical protein [Bradyrhizobium sp. USDA 4541]MCP1846772.1 hypothetical protein [Bradyrhizobium sp. USDA 4541]